MDGPRALDKSQLRNEEEGREEGTEKCPAVKLDRETEKWTYLLGPTELCHLPRVFRFVRARRTRGRCSFLVGVMFSSSRREMLDRCASGAVLDTPRVRQSQRQSRRLPRTKVGELVSDAEHSGGYSCSSWSVFLKF